MTTSGEFSGHFDSASPDLMKVMFGDALTNPARDVEVAPRGYRRPWYPLYVGKAMFDPPTGVDGDNGELIVNVGFRYVDAPVRVRVGWRRWWKHLHDKRPAVES